MVEQKYERRLGGPNKFITSQDLKVRKSSFDTSSNERRILCPCKSNSRTSTRLNVYSDTKWECSSSLSNITLWPLNILLVKILSCIFNMSLFLESLSRWFYCFFYLLIFERTLRVAKTVICDVCLCTPIKLTPNLCCSFNVKHK